MAGVVSRHCDLQRAGIRQADVFTGEPRHAPCNVERVFTCFQHPREPVDRRLRVGVAHRFVERGNDVIVLLPFFVVEEGLARDQLLQRSGVDGRHSVLKISVQDCHFQSRERRARVPVREVRDRCQRIIVYADILSAEAGGRLKGVAQYFDNVGGRQGLQHKDLAAGQKSPVDLKGRILRRRADQDDRAFLHKGQKSVLLRFVEPVDLIDKDDRLHAVLPCGVCLLHHGADLLDAARHRGEVDELGTCARGDDPCQSRLADAGRAPEDHR